MAQAGTEVMRETIYCSDDPARAMAERFVELARASDSLCVALSGGSTPRPFYRLLASEFADHIPWERIRLFMVDERCVPHDHPESNWGMMREALAPILDRTRAFPMDGSSATAAQDYETVLRREVPRSIGGIPSLDLLVLGMGADGHTASLFPDTKALECRDHFVVFNDVPHLKTRRITLTYPILEAAAHRWFLVTGADKAPAFERACRGELPAGRLPDAAWFVDYPVVE